MSNCIGRKIVVAGFPRAGTTMFYQMLRTTINGFETLPSERYALKAESQFDLRNTNIITKHPDDTRNFKKLKKFGWEFIIMIRDPRSVLCSKHYNTGNNYKISWDFRYETKKNKGITGKGEGLKFYCDKVLEIEATYPETPIIKYEDLVAHPDHIQHRLKKTMGFTFKEKFSNWYKYSVPEQLQGPLGKKRPTDSKKIFSWQNDIDRVKEQFEKFPKIQDYLEIFDYEKDSTWQNVFLNT